MKARWRRTMAADVEQLNDTGKRQGSRDHCCHRGFCNTRVHTSARSARIGNADDMS